GDPGRVRDALVEGAADPRSRASGSSGLRLFGRARRARIRVLRAVRRVLLAIRCSSSARSSRPARRQALEPAFDLPGPLVREIESPRLAQDAQRGPDVAPLLLGLSEKGHAEPKQSFHVLRLELEGAAEVDLGGGPISLEIGDHALEKEPRASGLVAFD